MGHQEGQSFTDIRFPGIIAEPLDPGRPFAVSAQATILRYFKEVLDARPHVMANDDIEAVHEIRVAARRTRTALQTFSTLWPEKDVRHWLDYLAKIADAFTIARDTDVLIEYLEKQLKGAAGKDEQAHRAAAMAWLLERARQRRSKEQPILEKLLRKSEKDHSAEAFVGFFSLKPVNLWQFDQLPPEPEPEPEPETELEEVAGLEVNDDSGTASERPDPSSTSPVVDSDSGSVSDEHSGTDLARQDDASDGLDEEDQPETAPAPLPGGELNPWLSTTRSQFEDGGQPRQEAPNG